MTGLLRQSIRFILVGIVNTATGLSVIYAAMYFFKANPVVANVIGYSIGICVSFALNRVWTFNSRRPIAHVLPIYLLVVGICYLLNLGTVVGAMSCLSINRYVAPLLGMCVYTGCMFLGCRWFVFPPQRSTVSSSKSL